METSHQINVKITSEELILGKFAKTLMVLHGYLTEAKGDVEIDQGYEPEAVLDRIVNIKEVFEEDIKKFSEDIKPIL